MCPEVWGHIVACVGMAAPLPVVVLASMKSHCASQVADLVGCGVSPVACFMPGKRRGQGCGDSGCGGHGASLPVCPGLLLFALSVQAIPLCWSFNCGGQVHLLPVTWVEIRERRRGPGVLGLRALSLPCLCWFVVVGSGVRAGL